MCTSNEQAEFENKTKTAYKVVFSKMKCLDLNLTKCIQIYEKNYKTLKKEKRTT